MTAREEADVKQWDGVKANQQLDSYTLLITPGRTELTLWTDKGVSELELGHKA